MDFRGDYKEKINIDVDELKFNDKGLIPAILQDYKSGRVLMMAYMNKEAYKKTIKTSKATFWSRSRQKIWVKGESSGNYQYVKDIKIDCDKDTLLLLVDPQGPACHTGNESCFYRKIDEIFNDKDNDLSFLNELYKIIVDRKENPTKNSYTSKMLKKGIDRIGKKIGEEASEVIIAAKNEDKEEIIYESADLIYHLMIMLVLNNISLDEINEELKRRHEN